jgi:hypothetical protein
VRATMRRRAVCFFHQITTPVTDSMATTRPVRQMTIRPGWATVVAQPVASSLLLHIPRRGPHPAREATWALRFCPIPWRPSQPRNAEGFPAVTLWTRTVPAVPCSILLEPDEWQALSCAIHRVPIPPAEPPPLGQAIPWMAQRGGFVGRRRRDRPGSEVLWRGFPHLGDLTTMCGIMRRGSP